MPTKPRTLVAALILSVVAVAVFAGHRYIHGYEQQIDNLELAKAHGRALHDYHDEHHSYPTVLSAVYPYLARESNARPGLDAWGHAFSYQSNGVAFILVSFGRDGSPKSHDYWHFRAWRTPRRTCGDPDADQVMSELRFHQACYK